MITRQCADVRTLAEVRDGIVALSVADWSRLKLAAARYSFGGAVGPDDLLQEALRRSLEKDGRKCPVDVDLVRFFAEAMRSIANGEREKAENCVEKVAITNGVEDGECVDPSDQSPDAEQLLAQAQESVARKASLLSLFIDDEKAREIIECIWLGYDGEELRVLTGLNEMEYDSKWKLVKRRIKRSYPNGWKL